MSTSVEVQRRSYPLAAYNFRVTVDQTAMSFTEVSGIAVQYDYVTYRHGLSFTEGETIQTFNFDRFVPVTCKRGVILGNSPLFLQDWLSSGDLRSMEVSLCDEKGVPVLSWKIAAAVPVSLRSPAFSANTNEAAIDTVELQVRGISIAQI